MPELPEVETIVTDLQRILPGMIFKGLEWEHENTVKGALCGEVGLKKKRVTAIKRRGKFINVFFEGEYVMTIHLRMSGRLIFSGLDDEKLRFERTRIDFDKGSLRFCDIRKFGRVWINKLENYEQVTGIKNLGIEPLQKDFTHERFIKIFARKKGNVKRLLLDQSLIAGIGNIYADEACFYSGIRPDCMIEKLSRKKLEELFEGVVKALKQGVKNRGTSISDFVDAYGKNGKNQELLYVYGRGGKPCLNCKTTLQRTVVAGRGTVMCPSCQK